jgi:protein-tyrosine phosphatase
MAQEYQPRSHEFPCSEAVVHAPIDDNFQHMSLVERKAVDDASSLVARALRRGKRVLVTCYKGWNRSGVVSAMALRKAYGMPPDQAIALVRRARGPWALSNPQFVKYIRRS